MKKRDGYWKRFEKTGGVLDYLNYTACTRETFPEEEDDEGEDDDRGAHLEWDGAFGHADGRI